MGLHSLINQDQYHASLSDKNNKADPNIGWDGITKVREDNITDTQGTIASYLPYLWIDWLQSWVR